MGGSSWSDDHYSSKVSDKATRGVPVFDYDHKVKTGAVPPKAHPGLDPRGVTRESRDSAAHPASVAIGVLFDGTGSMGTVPVLLQQKLPQLMGLLIRRGYLQDPQVLFGCIGDANSDRVALQIGQFESGAEMDDDITRLYLEGGGGGSFEESYELGLYFFAKHTAIDCFEKRGKKGYLFLIGDEKPYPAVKAAQVESIFGDKLQGNLPIEDVIAELRERYEVFFIIPTSGTSHGHGHDLKVLQTRWGDLLGEDHVLILQHADGVCETIAATVGLVEGAADAATVATDLKASGASDAIVHAVSGATEGLARRSPGPSAGMLPADSTVSGNERL